MTNYTYEQRQMIINELRQLLKTETLMHYGVSRSLDSDKLQMYEYAYPKEYIFTSHIKSRIQSLSSFRFGDIKTQIGTKFKMLSDFTYTIVKRYENNEPLILDSDNNVYPLDYLSDTDLVEVIK